MVCGVLGSIDVAEEAECSIGLGIRFKRLENAVNLLQSVGGCGARIAELRRLMLDKVSGKGWRTLPLKKTSFDRQSGSVEMRRSTVRRRVTRV